MVSLVYQGTMAMITVYDSDLSCSLMIGVSGYVYQASLTISAHIYTWIPGLSIDSLSYLILF